MVNNEGWVESGLAYCNFYHPSTRSFISSSTVQLMAMFELDKNVIIDKS